MIDVRLTPAAASRFMRMTDASDLHLLMVRADDHAPALAEGLPEASARDQGDVWFVNKPVRNELHPTMKPVELVERAINNSSKTRDIVLDCFGGSGTTLIACEKLNRQCRMIELDPKYADVIVRRWEEFTGKKAELVTTDK